MYHCCKQYITRTRLKDDGTTGHYETTEQSGSAGLQRGSQQDDDLSTVLSSFTMGETKGQCWRVSESHWDKLKQIMYLTYCTFHTPNVSNKHRSRASMGGADTAVRPFETTTTCLDCPVVFQSDRTTKQQQ